MGKYSGKLLTVFISPDGVRVCEGDNRNGDPNISQFFVVGGVSDYFALGTATTPTVITNLSELIKAIVEECKKHMVTAKRVMVCSNAFGIRTEIQKASVVGGIKDVLTGDMRRLANRKSKEAEFTPLTPDEMACKCTWGELTIEGEVKRVMSQTKGDKYMLQSIVREFYQYGYEVIHISGAVETLINFRQTEAASFDSQGKIIFDFDVGCVATVLVKDIPITFIRINMPERDLLIDRIRGMLKQALPLTGRNPHIYLTGSIFKDCELYNEVITFLEDEQYVVYDPFYRPELPDNYYERVQNGEIVPILTPDFGVNIAMLMAPFVKVMPQLTPSIRFSEIFKKNAQAVATLVLAASVIAFCVSGGFAIKRVFEMREIKSNPSNLASLSSQVSSLQVRQQSLNATINTLTQADTTVLNIMNFVEANNNERVVVVSVDTRDMLPGYEAVDGGVSTTTAGAGDGVDGADVFTGTSGGPGSVRENIVIRGYAKSGNEAVSYYNRFFNSGLATDPVLNGVERYELPDGDEVYVFEIEVISGGELSE